MARQPETIIITGGTRGLGAAISQALHEAGNTVVTTYAHDHDGANAFRNRTGIPVYCWDVTHPEACRKGVAEVEAVYGSCKVLIANAGIAHATPFSEMTSQVWKSVIDTNLGGCFNMARAVWPGMMARGGGRIINIASIVGQRGGYGLTAYAASKAGVMGLTRSLALEGAAAGIRVNAVSPGYMNSGMIAEIPDRILRKVQGEIPVGRLGYPEELARMILFLCGTDCDFITGQVLSLNGGQYME